LVRTSAVVLQDCASKSGRRRGQLLRRRILTRFATAEKSHIVAIEEEGSFASAGVVSSVNVASKVDGSNVVSANVASEVDDIDDNDDDDDKCSRRLVQTHVHEFTERRRRRRRYRHR